MPAPFDFTCFGRQHGAIKAEGTQSGHRDRSGASFQKSGHKDRRGHLA